MKKTNMMQTLDEKRITKVSFELGVSKNVVEDVINVLFKYMKSKIEAPELNNTILSKEEFQKKVPIIKIPALGYLVPSYKKYIEVSNNKIKKTRAKTTKNKEDE